MIRCACLELVELADQYLRVDHAPGAEHAQGARIENPGRDVVELVRLAAGDDRMAGVRAALVPADEVRVAGEQVDDLALAFVAPLRADDDGGGHRRELSRLCGCESQQTVEGGSQPCDSRICVSAGTQTGNIG
jgi:hypothetical protein